jgi:hypothetical protein
MSVHIFHNVLTDYISFHIRERMPKIMNSAGLKLIIFIVLKKKLCSRILKYNIMNCSHINIMYMNCKSIVIHCNDHVNCNETCLKNKYALLGESPQHKTFQFLIFNCLTLYFFIRV